jgi:o-succinylbenzoate synthase
LSIDDRPDFEKTLDLCCQSLIESGKVVEGLLADFPAIRFGLETALLDLETEKERILFPSDFTQGKSSLPINGLVWMGDTGYMKQQVREKLENGFTCLKLKIGALDFDAEVELIRQIRNEYTASEVELRVDANGAFHPSVALEKLKLLAEFDLHSIEQPIRQGQPDEIAWLCEQTPLPIALDEELIGAGTPDEKKKLLETIRPHYIVLKPSLLGGLKEAGEWIRLAGRQGINWWVTSALESNIGLNAIAQWVFTLKNPMPQGLGTGQLYSNNIISPLYIAEGCLRYDPAGLWDFRELSGQ